MKSLALTAVDALVGHLRILGNDVFGCNHCGTTFPHDPVLFTGEQRRWFFCSARCREQWRRSHMSEKARRGFAAMSPEKQRAIAGKGGRAAHAKGTAHQWTGEEAREAGRKGGQASHGGRGKDWSHDGRGPGKAK